jgi:sugar-specific transcriptional regulator TrmB
MTEIKVHLKEVESSLDELKSKISELNTNHSHPSFPVSSLDFITKIKAIEDLYYQIVTDYKNTLLNIECDVRNSIENLAETDRNIAKKMNI